jgi:hypothetical protein
MEDFHAIIKMCFAASVMCINASTCNGASAQCPWLAVAFAHLWACMQPARVSMYVCMRRLLTTVGNERAADTPYRAIRERQTAIIITTPPKLACVVEKYIRPRFAPHAKNGNKKSDGSLVCMQRIQQGRGRFKESLVRKGCSISLRRRRVIMRYSWKIPQL